MRRPEILAPAGDDDALAAALAAGADAVYFGLDEGWNARARATNFSLARLPELVTRLHRGGARAHVTLNTLVFESELAALERILRGVAAAGVDAIIVQDPAVALLARAICPALAVHASTQMTISSAEGARIAARLGATRVVVPRELSVDDIAAFAAASPIDLEVFIHGALCVSWSGQCLTSESFGGRSANRGQCAQSCRLPYDLIVDGEARDLGDVRYLLSPQDLAGAAAVPALIAAGVASLKIEGRQKGPAYVATAVEGYRRWRDSVLSGSPDEAGLAGDLAAMALAYSRGGSLGFLGGVDHQRLVSGLAPGHRGVYLGRVVARSERADPPAEALIAHRRGAGPSQHWWVEIVRDAMIDGADGGRPWTGGLAISARPPGPTGERSTELAANLPAQVAPRPGLGVVFDGGHPEADETGGPIFRVDELAPGRWLVGFGQPGPTLARVAIGDRVWITSDPAIHRAAERAVATEPEGRLALTLILRGAAGGPLTVTARATAVDGRRHEASATSAMALTASTGSGLDAALVASKLGALGGTRFHLAAVELDALGPALHLPVSELKALRRRLVDDLGAHLDRVDRVIAPGPVLAAVRAAAWREAASGPVAETVIVPLCRTDAQLDALVAAGADEVELDWMELVGLGKAVARARAAGARVVIATPRVQKPGEDKIVAHLRKLAPDAILVRSWAALATLTDDNAADAGPRPRLHGDFSLNLTNSISVGFALGLGLDTATVAHDLDQVQLAALVAACPPAQLAVTIHHHIPTFHTEHCVYAHLLSAGRDHRSCGRPCEEHEVALRDRTGLPHPVVVDVGCRNTVFHAQAQSAASLVPDLVARGVGRLRLELVRETGAEAARLYRAYRALAAGTISAAEVIRTARVHEQFGVTRSLRVIA